MLEFLLIYIVNRIRTFPDLDYMMRRYHNLQSDYLGQIKHQISTHQKVALL